MRQRIRFRVFLLLVNEALDFIRNVINFSPRLEHRSPFPSLTPKRETSKVARHKYLDFSCHSESAKNLALPLSINRTPARPPTARSRRRRDSSTCSGTRTTTAPVPSPS